MGPFSILVWFSASAMAGVGSAAQLTAELRQQPEPANNCSLVLSQTQAFQNLGAWGAAHFCLSSSIRTIIPGYPSQVVS